MCWIVGRFFSGVNSFVWPRISFTLGDLCLIVRTLRLVAPKECGFLILRPIWAKPCALTRGLSELRQVVRRAVRPFSCWGFPAEALLKDA